MQRLDRQPSPQSSSYSLLVATKRGTESTIRVPTFVHPLPLRYPFALILVVTLRSTNFVNEVKKPFPSFCARTSTLSCLSGYSQSSEKPYSANLSFCPNYYYSQPIARQPCTIRAYDRSECAEKQLQFHNVRQTQVANRQSNLRLAVPSHPRYLQQRPLLCSPPVAQS